MTRVTSVTTLQQLEELRFLWHAHWLRTRGATTCQSFASYWNWATSGHDREMLVLAVWDRAKLVGILPLARCNRRLGGTPVRLIRFPTPSLVPAMGPVGPEPTRTWLAVTEFLRRNARYWDVLDLAGIDPAIDAQRVATAAHFKQLTQRRVACRSWYRVPLESSDIDATTSNQLTGFPAAAEPIWEAAKELGTADQIAVTSPANPTPQVLRVIRDSACWIVLGVETSAASPATAKRRTFPSISVGQLADRARQAGATSLWLPASRLRSDRNNGLTRYLILSPRSIRGRLWSWWQRVPGRAA